MLILSDTTQDSSIWLQPTGCMVQRSLQLHHDAFERNARSQDLTAGAPRCGGPPGGDVPKYQPTRRTVDLRRGKTLVRLYGPPAKLASDTVGTRKSSPLPAQVCASLVARRAPLGPEPMNGTDPTGAGDATTAPCILELELERDGTIVLRLNRSRVSATFVVYYRLPVPWQPAGGTRRRQAATTRATDLGVWFDRRTR